MSLTLGSTTTTESLTAFKMIAVTDEYIDHTFSDTENQTPLNGIYFTAIAKRSGTGASASWSTYDSSGSSHYGYDRALFAMAVLVRQNEAGEELELC